MDIDNLQIQIQSEAKSASSTIDALCRKIDKLSVSLNQLDGSRVVAFASGVKALNNAAQGLNNIKTPDFTRLAKNLTAMNNLNLSNLSNISTNMNRLASSMNGLTGLSNSAQQVTEFTKSLSALGNKSATNAISNLPNLATAMNDFITKMSKVPKVSQNTIDLTNALARLARTGASSGRAANSLSTAFNGMNRSSRLAYGGITKLNVGIGSLRGLLGKLAPLIGAISFVKLGKDAIDTASQLTEVQNVVDTTFGNYSQMVEDMAKTSIQDYGMSELTAKKISSRFQAMGTAMGFPQKQMAGMSVELTKLAADMASFYDVSQNDVAKSLQSVFTGETEPVRKFGLDVTNATLKQWALNNGLNANISSMSQAEKAMLRYQYVMANTTAAQGDFAKTSGSWANQVRILAENFKALGSVVGNVLINAFKPVIQFLNKVVVAVTSAVETIANALGAIFGWTVEVSSGGQTLDDTASGMDDIGTSADNAGNSMGGAAQKAKELKKALMGFDEIEKLPDPTSGSSGSGGSGGSGGGSSGAGGSSAGTAQIVKTDSIFEKYKSDIKDLEGLGKYIGDALKNAMDNIPWNEIYEKARKFGTGLADFLNGLFEGKKGETLLGKVGKTVAGTLNTVIEASLAFTKEFDFYQFGLNLADAVNQFFENFGFKKLAEAINGWAKGIKETIRGFLENLTWSDILEGAIDFLGTLNLDTVEVLIGAFTLKNGVNGIKQLLAGSLASALVGGISISDFALSIQSFTLANMSSPAFIVIATEIVEGISDALESVMPTKAFDMLSKIGAGMVAGGAVGTAIPGLGTVAGIIVGGITGGLSEVMPTKALEMLGAIVAGIGGGATVGSAIPGIGTVAGAIVGGLGAAIPFIPFDDVWKGIVSGFEKVKNKVVEFDAKVKDGASTWWKDVKDYWSKKKQDVAEFSAKVKDDSNTWWANVKGWWSGKVGEVKEFTTSVSNQASTWWSNTQKWWSDKAGSVKEFTTNVKNDASTWWSNVQKWWNEKTIYAGVFAVNVRREVGTWLGNIRKWWNEKTRYAGGFTTGVINQARTWWSNVKSWWNKRKGYAGGFTTGVINQARTWWSNVKSWWNSYTRGKSLNVNSTITTTHIDKYKKVYGGGTGRGFADGGVYKNGKWSPVTMAASGGLFNEGQMFVAREAGPELVGTIGGHTAVMNNNQIVASVSAGVYRAVASAISQVMSQSQGSGASPVINVYVGGRQVTDVVVEQVNQRTRATGVCPIMV